MSTKRPSSRFMMLETFLRIHDRRSVSKAARDLGISQPTATKLLREFEDLLGAELIRRSTREVTPTAAGDRLAEDARQLLGAWDRMLERHGGERMSHVTLRIVAPVGFGQYELFDLVADFMILNPGLSVAWQLENGPIAFHGEGADLWICFGPVADKSLVVRKVGSLTTVVVAAPSYARGAKIGRVDSLERLEAITLDSYLQGVIDLTEFDGTARSLNPSSRITTNNFPSMYRAVRRGLGFAAMPLWFVADDLATGKLIDLLPGCIGASVSINLVYAPRRYRAPMLEALIERLMQAIPDIDGVSGPRSEG